MKPNAARMQLSVAACRHGKCSSSSATVKDGRFGDTSLNGVRAVVVAKYPNAIHEGHGHVALFIDEKATDEQANALATILSGKLGGMPWEALAGTIERFEGPIRKPIEIKVAGERSKCASRRGRTPAHAARDPVTAKRSQIAYPKGGFWDDARVATTSSMRLISATCTSLPNATRRQPSQLTNSGNWRTRGRSDG